MKWLSVPSSPLVLQAQRLFDEVRELIGVLPRHAARSFKKFALVAMLSCGLGASFTATPLLCGEAIAADSGKNGIDSVVLELAESKDEFEAFMDKSLSPKMANIAASFKANVKRAEELLNQIQKDPANRALQAQYEDALSEAITQASGILKEFQSLKDPTLSVMNKVSAGIDKVVEHYDTVTKSYSGDQSAATQAATEIKSKLSKLALEYRAQIESNEPLPEDVALDIRFLQMDLQVAEAFSTIDQVGLEDAKHAVVELTRQRDNLNSLKSDLLVAFHQAGGQEKILGRLAAMKGRRIETQMIYAKLARVRTVVTRHKTKLDNIEQLVKSVVGGDLKRGGGNGPGTEDKPDLTGNEILRQFLPQATATAN